MAFGPNQTGSTLQSPLSAQLGFGTGLINQVDQETEEAKRKRLLQQMAAARPGMVSQSLLSNMTGGY